MSTRLVVFVDNMVMFNANSILSAMFKGGVDETKYSTLIELINYTTTTKYNPNLYLIAKI